MGVRLVPHKKPTGKVLNLNRKLVCTPIDKLRRRVGGPHKCVMSCLAEPGYNRHDVLATFWSSGEQEMVKATVNKGHKG